MVYDRWTLHIDKVTSDFQKEFSALSPSELNWRPRPNAWSIGQNIDHLIVTNSTYFHVVHALKIGQYNPPLIAKFKFVVAWTGQHIFDAVQPDRSKKVKTFPMWQPLAGNTDEKILDKFAVHQDSLKQLVEDSYDLLDKKAVISSPANRFIVYELSTAFDIIITHEKRHFEQAKEVLRLLLRRTLIT